MKTQLETTIQFSGYPLTIVESPAPKKAELAAVKSISGSPPPSPLESAANNPQNWGIDWFNSYE